MLHFFPKGKQKRELRKRAYLGGTMSLNHNNA